MATLALSTSPCPLPIPVVATIALPLLQFVPMVTLTLSALVVPIVACCSHGWPQWHCPLPVHCRCTDGHIDAVGYVAVDQYPDLLAHSLSCQWPQWLCWLAQLNVASLSCSRSYRGTLLSSFFGGTLSLLINHIVAPVSTGCINYNCC
jgi:hypothetical protein